jgi:hypothetical protein
MSLYRVTYWLPSDARANGYEVRTETCGSEKAARLAAVTWLRRYPTVTTNDCYHRDRSRGASVSVHRLAKKTLRAGSLKRAFWEREKQVADIIAPVYIVPSVGELGYTP